MSKRHHSEEPPIITAATGGDDAGSDSTDDRVAALCKDIERFSHNKMIPQGLGLLVDASEETLSLWYLELAVKWQESPPTTAEEATFLVYRSLRAVYPYFLDVMNLEGFLYFYKLPHHYVVASLIEEDSPESSMNTLEPVPHVEDPMVEEDFLESPLDTLETISHGEDPMVEADASEFLLKTLPVVDTYEKAQMFEEDAPEFLLRTLPVTEDKVIDGGCFTVSIEVNEHSLLSSSILYALVEHHRAHFKGDDYQANEMLKRINDMEDYGIMHINNVETLTRRYQIRLRGIDAPGMETPSGVISRNELVKMVVDKCLTIAVYYLDDDSRCVADAYYDGTLLQARLLKKCQEKEKEKEKAEEKCPGQGKWILEERPDLDGWWISEGKS